MSEEWLRCFDAFAGTGSSTKGFVARGHDVAGIELDTYGCKSPPWIKQGDIFDMAKDPEKWLDEHVAPGWRPDHFHASPSCEMWCVPSINTHWEYGYGTLTPKTEAAKMGMRMLEATVHIIRVLLAKNPKMTFTIENPRAKMRVAVEMFHKDLLGEPKEAMYCVYGPLGPVPVLHGPDHVWAQKATDFWSNLDWTPRYCDVRYDEKKKNTVFHNGLEFVLRNGEPCHERASRSAKAGIQRIKGAGPRAMFPLALAEEICEMAEKAHGIKREETEVKA